MTKDEAEGLMGFVGKHATLQGAIKERGGEVYQFTLTGALTIPEPFLVYGEAVRRLREAGVKIKKQSRARVKFLNRRQIQIRYLSNN
jgi:hypothetical protein